MKETVTCCECGKITAGKKENDLFICPECWAKFRQMKPHEQLQDLMKRLGVNVGYKSVSEVAKETGLSKVAVNDECHRHGQKYAFRLKPRGRWYIDIDKFKQSIERRTT